jgi:hypothetical protein
MAVPPDGRTVSSAFRTAAVSLGVIHDVKRFGE